MEPEELAELLDSQPLSFAYHSLLESIEYDLVCKELRFHMTVIASGIIGLEKVAVDLITMCSPDTFWFLLEEDILLCVSHEL